MELFDHELRAQKFEGIAGEMHRVLSPTLSVPCPSIHTHVMGAKPGDRGEVRLGEDVLIDSRLLRRDDDSR